MSYIWIKCSSCAQNMYYVHTGHISLNAVYNMCTTCGSNSSAINFAKNYHKLIEKSQFDSIMQQLQQKNKEIQKLKQINLDKYFQNGEGLKNFITEKLATYINQYNKYVQNIKTKEPCLTRFVTQSIERTLGQVERGILTIIGREAQTISQNVAIENQDNDKRIKASEAYREKRRAEMTEYAITTSHSKTGCKNKDDNPEIREFIYDKSEVAAVMKVYEANIEKYKTTGVSLSKLIQQGQKIYDELIREQKVAMNTSVTEASENQSLVLQNVE